MFNKLFSKFKKLLSTPKTRMYTIIGAAAVLFLIVFIIVTVTTPDKNRLVYNEKSDGTYEVTDIKDLYRGGLLVREKITVPSEYKGKKVTSIKRIESLVIKEVVLPDTITSIEGGAFAGMQKLEKINIPSSVTKIEINTFASCYNLKEITLPESIKEIGNKAFYNTSLEEIIIPSSVTKIGSEAFKDCKNLTKIEGTFSNIEVGGQAFDGTKFAEDIYDKNNGFLIIDKILYSIRIDEETITGDKKKGYNLVIPEGVEVIASGVIHEDLNLFSITFPSTLKKICSKALKINDTFGIGKIKEIYFKGNVEDIAEDAVKDFDSIKAVVFMFDKNEITTEFPENSLLNKGTKVYLSNGNYMTDVQLEKDSEELTALYFDFETYKPYKLENDTKVYFNQTKYLFEE